MTKVISFFSKEVVTELSQKIHLVNRRNRKSINQFNNKFQKQQEKIKGGMRFRLNMIDLRYNRYLLEQHHKELKKICKT